MIRIKNKFVSIFLCLALLVGALGLGLSFGGEKVVPASAETISVETENAFWLVPGARIRYADDGVTGISYRFQIKDSIYQNNKTDYVAVKYGILIAPKEYDLSYEKVFGNDAIYDWAEKDQNGEYVYSGDGSKTRIVNLEATALKRDYATVNGEKTAVRYFNGNMVNIKPSNLTREFQAKGYFAYSTDGVSYTYVDQFVGNEDNVRSIVYVAQQALQDQSADAPTNAQKELLTETYLTQDVLQTTTTYTTEHYIQQANGEYTVAYTDVSSEVLLNTEVSATPKTIDGFNYDAENENNVTSGVVLANGKLVLKLYYKADAVIVTINGGDLAGDAYFTSTDCGTVTVAFGSTLALNGTSCEGYRLVGWRKSDGSIVVGSYVATSSETLTAIWIRDPFSIRWGEWTPIS